MNAFSPRCRFLSVWLRRLPTDRIARLSCAPAEAALEHFPAKWEPVRRRKCVQTKKPERVSDSTQSERALVVAAPVKSALRLVAVDDKAARLGLKRGMALADARAMYPALAVAEADPHADQALLEAVAAWCDRYTPLVGLDPPDGLVLDVSGCAHLFGGEAALACDLARRLEGQGFRLRVAVADTVGCAWGIARYGEDETVEPGMMREALAALPLAALRLPPETVEALNVMGLKHVADVIERPRAPLAARFGVELIRRIDQALGHEEESIAPLRPLPCYVAERRFADPVVLEHDVLGTIERLASQLAGVLERHGEGARRVEAVLFRADGKVLRLSAATSRPVRDPALIRRLFAERLVALGEESDPGFGFDLLRLGVIAAEPLDPLQTGFGPPDHGEELARLIDRLGARFGLARVRRIVANDTHIPEFAAIEVPAHVAATVAGGSSAVPAQDSLAPVRPVRLFARPEAVEAIAEVPDGPPVRFRWRKVLHEVASAEGPERIAMEWWRDDEGRALTRDYFRVENGEGARFWLYREGLYGREGERPRWFLHGLFA
jgi:protein ImuB